MAPSAAHLEPAGLISQLGFFLLLPLPFHFTRSEKTFQAQSSLNTRELLQFTPSSCPTPSCCKEEESSLFSGSSRQHIHRAPEARTMLHTLMCSGDPALAEGILQRKPHTPITNSYHTSLSWQCCSHRKVSGEQDVLCHCLFLCPALTWHCFCPNTLFFFCTKEGLFPPLQDPFSSAKHRLGNKDCREAAWSGTEERAVMDVCTGMCARLG